MTRGFSPKDSFGIDQVEVYDPLIHTDAVRLPKHDKEYNPKRQKRDSTPDNIIEKDPFYGDDAVFERWCRISRKAGDVITRRYVMRFANPDLRKRQRIQASRSRRKPGSCTASE